MGATSAHLIDKQLIKEKNIIMLKAQEMSLFGTEAELGNS